MEKNLHIEMLIISDKQEEFKPLLEGLLDFGLTVNPHYVSSLQKFEETFTKTEIDLALADLDATAFQGNSTINRIKAKNAELPVLLMIEDKDIEKAIQLMKSCQIQDFVYKHNTIRLGLAVKREVVDSRIRINHKLSERKLEESHARYEAIVEGMPFLQVCRWKPDTTLTYYNLEYAKTYGLNTELNESKKWIDFLPPENRKTVEKKVDELLSKPGSYTYEHASLDKNGNLKYFLWIDKPVLDKSGNVIEYQSVGRDITDRKQVEDKIKNINKLLESQIKERTKELETAYKEMESFSYSISHDLKTPLRNIISLSQILQKNLKEKLDEKNQLLLGDIFSSADKMSLLVESLLNLSKMGYKQIKPEEVPIREFAESIIEQLKGFYEHKEFDIKNELPDKIVADRTLIFQVFQNILDNAFKYASKNKKIKVCIMYKQLGGNHTITISDNGTGFDEAYIDRMFEPFRRLHGNDEFPGIGVGLAITKKIIEKHGGSIRASSPEGKGTVMEFTLPQGIQT